MISLSRIVEQQGAEGQYYDIGKDFSNFTRTINGANDQIKQKFEQAIATKLVGKRIKARASRGYKQYVKDYEFDVVKVTLDDYYDNYVVVAHDNTTPKPKEYFLKSGFKIQIIGPATGQPSPQKGDKPGDQKPQEIPNPVQPRENPNLAQQQPMAQAPMGNTPSEQPLKETKGYGYYDAYSIDNITQDIKPWLPSLLIKPETVLRDFIRGLGWQKQLNNETNIAMFDLKIPFNSLKSPINSMEVEKILFEVSKIDIKYNLVEMEPNETHDEWNVRIRKTMTNKSI
jgi:molybdopterin converting factor small subunit